MGKSKGKPKGMPKRTPKGKPGPVKTRGLSAGTWPGPTRSQNNSLGINSELEPSKQSLASEQNPNYREEAHLESTIRAHQTCFLNRNGGQFAVPNLGPLSGPKTGFKSGGCNRTLFSL